MSSSFNTQSTNILQVLCGESSALHLGTSVRHSIDRWSESWKMVYENYPIEMHSTEDREDVEQMNAIKSKLINDLPSTGECVQCEQMMEGKI